MAKNETVSSNKAEATAAVKPVTSQKVSVTPTETQVKNQNQVQTKNEGEDSQLSVKTQEFEMMNNEVNESFEKVSNQVHMLIETTGAKDGLGQEVKDIAQNQIKLQDEVKMDLEELNSRGKLTKALIGSDKKLIKSMEQKMEQNQLMIQQLEQLKLETKNEEDFQQLEETIQLMTDQNTSLQTKVNEESKINGMFGWLLNLFNK